MSEQKFICENCGKEHDGSYGSGRFCCIHCAKSYAGKLTKNHSSQLGKKKTYICKFCGSNIVGSIEYKKHINICPNRMHPHKGYNNWKCNICGEIFQSRRKLQKHRKEYHFDESMKSNHYCESFCQYCGKKSPSVSGNSLHEKYCKFNVNRVEYIGHPHTQDIKHHLSDLAKKQCLGGKHTSRSFNYNGINLDSTYELKLAEILDNHNIKWERPSYFIWHLNNEEHRYYPDFYIPEYNLYLDPKNDYLINSINPRFGITDKEKIKIVKKENNINLIILDKNQINWEYIKNFI